MRGKKGSSEGVNSRLVNARGASHAQREAQEALASTVLSRDLCRVRRPAVREATLRDIEAMAPLFEEVDAVHLDHHPERFRSPGWPPRSREYLEQVMSSEHSTFLVVEFERRLVGLVNVAVYEAPKVPVFQPRVNGVVSDLIVTGSFRRRGIGRLLLEEAEVWVRRRGATSIELVVYEFNDGARRFYESLGYATLSRSMEKPLS